MTKPEHFQSVLLLVDVLRLVSFCGFGAVLLLSIYKFKGIVFTAYGFLLLLNLLSLYLVLYMVGNDGSH